MAVGRQDYQAGVVPVKSGYSLAQTPFYKGETITLANGVTDVICVAVVDTGYQISISGLRISCNWPGIQLATYYLGEYWETPRYFDMISIDNFPEETPLVCVATSLIGIKLTNNTGQTVIYNGEIFGFQEQIEV